LDAATEAELRSRAAGAGPGSGDAGGLHPEADVGATVLAAAYAQHKSNVLVQGDGLVTRILRDDLHGARHQRFLLRLASGQTVLIAHNIDVAQRVEPVNEGDRVAFRGEYEWNEQGGIIHWTHHVASGDHASGWLEHAGRRYE